VTDNGDGGLPPWILPEIIDIAERLFGNPYFLLVLIGAVGWFGYYSLRKR